MQHVFPGRATMMEVLDPKTELAWPASLMSREERLVVGSGFGSDMVLLIAEVDGLAWLNGRDICTGDWSISSFLRSIEGVLLRKKGCHRSIADSEPNPNSRYLLSSREYDVRSILMLRLAGKNEKFRRNLCMYIIHSTSYLQDKANTGFHVCM